jgi:inhibitor of cysteine peptidase
MGIYIISIMRNTTISLIAISAIVVLAVSSVAGMGIFLPKTFDATSSGQNTTVNLGDTFVISLPENPTTGYSWNITTTDGLARLNDAYAQADRSGMQVGVGGTHKWEIKATKIGPQTVTGVYKRPWEGLSGDEQTYGLNVNVVQGGWLSGLFRMPATLLRPGMGIS